MGLVDGIVIELLISKIMLSCKVSKNKDLWKTDKKSKIHEPL